MIFAENSCFRRFSPFLVSWSVSGPPGRLKNLNIPIGITRFSACGGQGTTRILQRLFLACFCRICRNSAGNCDFLVNLGKMMDCYDFSGFWGSKPLRPWFWARNTKVSWRVAESRNQCIPWNFMIFMKFLHFHWISCFQWISYNLQEIHRIAPACKKTSNSYAFSMVAALLFAPGHPKTGFFLNFMNFYEISWNFMKFHESSEILLKFRFCGLPGVPGSSTLAFS